MEHQTFGGEVTVHHEPAPDNVKRIIRTTILLSIITIIELGIGYLLYLTSFGDTVDLMFKGAVIILSFAKAFYIVSVFMHLGDEIRNLIMTIVVPLLLFVWFIIAFLWDGNSWKNLRNDYAPKDPVKFEQQVTEPVKEGGLN
ncbi:MAG TPA: cytochrome C oxidase subunit IV family protein [Lacibacter sp.]|nr:cytochrome C oxidase subunit IV family protein [Lacibacter sp.]HMO88355.1 cytochrome C oxidase subunit IV family protein [Lacibacter sp.]HMP87477.1 cytochrome C oxidase subunit IV family protein [Lacibacter sp.]